MSMKPLKCPNCGSPSVKATKNGNEYQCASCWGIIILDSNVQILVLSVTLPCPKCGRANSASARYCGTCGHSLVYPCPFCWSEHQPGERYCQHCGQLMRGIPQTTPDDVISIVEENSQRSDRQHPLFPSLPPMTESVQKELASIFKLSEIAIWSFVAPRNEQFRRNFYGYLLYVLDNDMLLRDGLFIATSSRFLYYVPGTPEKKGLFGKQPGSPPFHLEYPYSEIIGFRFDSHLPVPREALNAILSEYSNDYYPPKWEVQQASTVSGWEVSLSKNRFLRFEDFPHIGGMEMNRLRFWERIFRSTLGIARSDLDYIPCPSPL